jgi:UrcA family protein
VTRLALFVVLAAMAAAPAFAGERQTLMAMRLEVNRLDGDAAMMRRLNITARAMCARINSPLFPGNEGRAWKCRREAVAAALGRRGVDVDA